MNETTLASRLTVLRNRCGQTQDAVAQAIGISPKTLSKWENAASEPECAYLCALADYYGVTTDYLLGRTECETPDTWIDRFSAELSDLPAADAVKKTFSASQALLHTFISNRIHDTDAPLTDAAETVPPTTIAPATRSMITQNGVFGLCVNHDALNMTVLLTGNRAHFSWLYDETVLADLSDYLGWLSDPTTLRLMREIHRPEFPLHFTSSYAAECAGVTPKDAENCLLHRCDKQTAHLEEGDKTVYYHGGDGFAMSILSLAYELCRGNKAMTTAITQR